MHIKYAEAQTSSHRYDAKVRRGKCQLRCRPRDLTMVKNPEVVYGLNSFPCQNYGSLDKWCRHLSSLRGISPSSFVLSPVWCPRPKPTTGLLLAPYHDELRGFCSNYGKQVVLATTTTATHESGDHCSISEILLNIEDHLILG
ncbi:uncharacterized protein TNCV_909751 [Trichonephila clavipes]|nr:uncharacterized protein TNCV_909751 [Trichonephila clavipes]